ncbi:hypothetical protein E2P81_ATG03032 [Venturia nashicola]|nr:hypothetical protein E2P81_ATG03032 [Venturia nashicola]
MMSTNCPSAWSKLSSSECQRRNLTYRDALKPVRSRYRTKDSVFSMLDQSGIQDGKQSEVLTEGPEVQSKIHDFQLVRLCCSPKVRQRIVDAAAVVRENFQRPGQRLAPCSRIKDEQTRCSFVRQHGVCVATRAGPFRLRREK